MQFSKTSSNMGMLRSLRLVYTPTHFLLYLYLKRTVFLAKMEEKGVEKTGEEGDRLQWQREVASLLQQLMSGLQRQVNAMLLDIVRAHQGSQSTSHTPPMSLANASSSKEDSSRTILAPSPKKQALHLLRKSAEKTIRCFKEKGNELELGFSFNPSDSEILRFLARKAVYGEPPWRHLFYTVDKFFEIDPYIVSSIIPAPIDGHKWLFFTHMKSEDVGLSNWKRKRIEKKVISSKYGGWVRTNRKDSPIIDTVSNKQIGRKIYLRYPLTGRTSSNSTTSSDSESSTSTTCASFKENEWNLILYTLDQIEWAAVKLYRRKEDQTVMFDVGDDALRSRLACHGVAIP